MCVWDNLKPQHQALLSAIKEGDQPPTHGIKRLTLYTLDERGLVHFLPIEARWALTQAGEAVFEEHALCGNTVAQFSPGQLVDVLTWSYPGGRFIAHWNRHTVAQISSDRLLVRGHWRQPRCLRPVAVKVAV